MPRKGPHISISPEAVVNRILRIDLQEFAEWPESVRSLAIDLAQELFLVICNPFIDPEMVRQSVAARFKQELFSLANHYANTIDEGITLFWKAYESEMEFRDELVQRLGKILPEESIITSPGALVSCATDATDLRLELPMLIVEPTTTDEVSALVRLANEMKFAIIPVGGASGMTGGAVPVRRRTVIVRMTRLTHISDVDFENNTITVQSGVITQNAVDAAARQGRLFTVDPASRVASSIGGNIAENSGGPYAFEYGTTLDNLLSWRMVMPTGEIIEVVRRNHPCHKILPEETVIFDVRDVKSGEIRSVIELPGDEIRLPGLGKDVTNKALGGLPGVQKEGVDGIITDATFIVHPIPALSRVMLLEFFGSSMHEAALVIREIVELRNRIRREGDYAKLSALEEFNSKYIQAIEYKKKSDHPGQPISVVILQADGDDEALLNKAVQEIGAIAARHNDVAFLVARDAREAELFWEGRHRLSAIAKRTSGFKVNEDIVIPTDRIPDFANFLERTNLHCAGLAYREALQDVGRLPGLPSSPKGLNKEFGFATQIIELPEGSPMPCTDEELMARARAYLDELAASLPELAKKIGGIKEKMDATRLIVASHMHAGDGNCHVNIPVNSNDAHMLQLAEKVVDKVMATAKAMGGAVSGEHGIGITKLRYLDESKMEAIREFKERVDPREVCNPAKLVRKELPARPYTFSFNRLLSDLKESGLPEKERLIHLLQSVQNCTRCGKCKQVCPMLYPERGMQYHPRNKNMVVGAVIEAITYSQITAGKPSPEAMAELRRMVEHCTGCRRCEAVCPVHIPSAEVALALRAFLEKEGAGGHPLKSHILSWLVRKPDKRVPRVAKVAAIGQKAQNQVLNFVPSVIRSRFTSPLFASKGPSMNYTNLYDALHIRNGHIFEPTEKSGEAVLYFPGCGGSLFSRAVGLSSLALLLKSGAAVIVPPHHLCCGYPLLSSGADDAFERNKEKNCVILKETLDHARAAGLQISYVITACGSCREGLENYELNELGELPEKPFLDVTQYVIPRLKGSKDFWPKDVVYHAACHAAWANVHKVKGVKLQAEALEAFTGAKVRISQRCCGESGMGAMTSPQIYNLLRERKMEVLEKDLENYDPRGPVLVGCPSCKIGIARSLIRMGQRRPVLHTAEWLARMIFAPVWGDHWLRTFTFRIDPKADERGVRPVDVSF